MVLWNTADDFIVQESIKQAKKGKKVVIWAGDKSSAHRFRKEILAKTNGTWPINLRVRLYGGM